jgi:hypothetical protein
MNLDRVERIAEAVLYEGYMLYPYRASALKNQQRWNFGVLSPRSYCAREGGSDRWMMQTECLLQSAESTRLDIEIRFLQIVNRSIGKLLPPLPELPSTGEADFELVKELIVGDRLFTPWQEARERKLNIPPWYSASHASHRDSFFEFPSSRELEPIRDSEGTTVGVIIRECELATGSVEIDLKTCGDSVKGDGLIKATVHIRNLTVPTSESPEPESRAHALMHSFVSVHTILGAENAQFISLLDPPAELGDLARECLNLGTWPVLVGDAGDRNTMLSSPIILYDYPEIAPESPGSLFDGTEIDEILSLRILTMTDEEKREMRQSDARAKEILERTESMPPEQFMKMHGVLRGLRPVIQETR